MSRRASTTSLWSGSLLERCYFRTHKAPSLPHQSPTASQKSCHDNPPASCSSAIFGSERRMRWRRGMLLRRRAREKNERVPMTSKAPSRTLERKSGMLPHPTYSWNLKLCLLTTAKALLSRQLPDRNTGKSVGCFSTMGQITCSTLPTLQKQTLAAFKFIGFVRTRPAADTWTVTGEIHVWMSMHVCSKGTTLWLVDLVCGPGFQARKQRWFQIKGLQYKDL